MLRPCAFGVVIFLGAAACSEAPSREDNASAGDVQVEWTYPTAPRQSDGTYDYVGLIDKRFRRGLTPAKNAMVPMIKALGPEVIPEQIREAYLKALGIDALPVEGDYFEPFDGDFEQLDATYEPWRREDAPAVAKWLDEQAAPLALAVEASEKPRFYSPIATAEPPRRALGIRAPHLAHPLTVGRALVSRAMLRWGEGDQMTALADLDAASALGLRVCEGPSVVENLVGLAIWARADLGLRAAAMSGDAGRDELAAMLEARLNRDVPRHPMRATAEFERLSVLDSVKAIAEGWEAPLLWHEPLRVPRQYRRVTDWAKVMAAVSGEFDRMIEVMSIENWPKRQRAAEGLEARWQAREARVKRLWEKEAGRLKLTPNPAQNEKRVTEAVTELLLHKLFPTILRAEELHRRSLVDGDLTVLTIALQQYHAEHGAYPDDLAILSPKYLKETPVDRFSDESLKYRVEGEGFALYSVGRDTEEDSDQSAFLSDDIVVRHNAD